MIVFEDINPTEPLLWVNQTPVIMLDYLLHLTQDTSDNHDILWKLTRQLIVVELVQDQYPISEDVLEKQYQDLLHNEVIHSVINTHAVEKSTFVDLLKKQEIYLCYWEELKTRTISSLEEDNTHIKNYYEDSEQFERSDVFEVFECELRIDGYHQINSLKDLHKYGKNVKWLGIFSEEELLDYLPSEEEVPLKEEIPIIIPLEDGKALFVAQFHTSYKPSFELIQQQLIEMLAENNIEYELEDFVQEKLDTVSLRYNESAIKKALNLIDNVQEEEDREKI